MGIELIGSLLQLGGFLKIIHFLIVILIALYVLFALIVVRQVKLLNNSLKTDAAFFLSTIAYVHLFMAIVVLVIGVLAL